MRILSTVVAVASLLLAAPAAWAECEPKQQVLEDSRAALGECLMGGTSCREEFARVEQARLEEAIACDGAYTPPLELPGTFDEGWRAGARQATRAYRPWSWGARSAAASAVTGPVGCATATGGAYLDGVPDAPEPAASRDMSAAFRRGFDKGYEARYRQKRVEWAVRGGVIGTAVLAGTAAVVATALADGDDGDRNVVGIGVRR